MDRAGSFAGKFRIEESGRACWRCTVLLLSISPLMVPANGSEIAIPPLGGISFEADRSSETCR